MPAKVLGVRLYGRNSGILIEYYDIANERFKAQETGDGDQDILKGGLFCSNKRDSLRRR